MKIKNLKTSKKGMTVKLTFWQEVKVFFGIKPPYKYVFDIEVDGDLCVGNEVIVMGCSHMIVIERLSRRKFVLLTKEFWKEEPVLGDDLFILKHYK